MANIKKIVKRHINYFKYQKICKSNEALMNAKAGNLIRETHAIEKGLSLPEPRLGYGHERQKKVFVLVDELKDSNDLFYKEAVKMALAALKAYVDYHDSKNYSDDFIELMKTFINDHSEYMDPNVEGGVKKLSKDECNVNLEEIQKLFYSRHSIRDFSDEPVDVEKIKKAVELAKYCPSACNRQGFRTYLTDASTESTSIISEWATGVGGFQESINEYLVITAKTTVYNEKEANHYIVTAGIYAGYLSLALQAYGIGACVIQRSPNWNEKWASIQKKLYIPSDELAICLIGVGNLKDEMYVPVSHRLDTDVIFKKI